MTRLGITGHQQLPPAAEALLRERLRELVTGPVTGVTSLAAGADQVAAEEVLRAGGRLHVVLPCSRYADAFGSPAAVATYRALLASASEVELLPYDEPSEQAFLSAGRRVVDLSGVLVAAWDGRGATGAGGTGDVVGYARERGKEVVVVWPSGLAR